MEIHWSGIVDQRTDGDEIVSLEKTVLKLPPAHEGAPSLALIRKHQRGGHASPCSQRAFKHTEARASRFGRRVHCF